ncbi:CHAT domain protein [Ceratobasidium sp. AG-Ba]|nr:CHAT domain protein [Ceratobasidium sp. AG-Ba]
MFSRLFRPGGTTVPKPTEVSSIKQDQAELEKRISLAEKGSRVHLLLVLEHCVSLYQRFQALEQLSDVDKAVQQLEDLLGDIHRHREYEAAILSHLSLACILLFEGRRQVRYIDRAISCCDKALASDLSRTGPIEIFSMVFHLGVGYNMRFGHSKDDRDLTLAIHYLNVCVLSKPSGDLMPSALNEAGLALLSRFERFGEQVDIDGAIALQKKSISSPGAENNDAFHKWLGNLGKSMRTRFERTGDPNDLEQGIYYVRRSMKLIPKDSIMMAIRLNELGALLCCRFEHSGRLPDLDHAIGYYRKALEIVLAEHPEKPRILGSLAYALFKRFQLLKERHDIDESIRLHEQFFDLSVFLRISIPAGNYSNAGLSFMERHSSFGRNDDIERAIEQLREAVKPIHPDEPMSSRYVNNLGTALLQRFHWEKRPEDIDEAISCLRQALSTSSGLEGDAHVAGWLGNLGNAYRNRYAQSNKGEDLDSSIDYYQQSLRRIPQGHIFHAGIQYSLAEMHGIRHSATGGWPSQDAFICISHFREVTKTISGSPGVRFQAACGWARFCRPTPLSLEPYQIAIDLLPQVVWLGTSIERRYKNISSTGDIVNDAAGAAIEFGHYDLALEWLEAGRSIIWNQTLQLRTPLDDLATVQPKLAARLKEIARFIEVASENPSNSRLFGEPLPSEKQSQMHRRMAEEWDERVKQARLVPGFEGFMRHKKANELVRACKSGPIIVINVQTSRSDALIVLPGSNEIQRVALPGMTNETAKAAHAQLIRSLQRGGVRSRGFTNRRTNLEPGMKSMLATLWVNVVAPILEALGYNETKAVPPEEMPHVTWCTTGYLSFLPLHAAGIYGQPGRRVFDYVVSSYVPTLGLLLGASQNTEPPRGMTFIGQSDSLPKVLEEMRSIKKQVPSEQFICLDNKDATIEAVRGAMRESSWVHLACHARQDTQDPRRSGFILHDGTLELAAIASRSLKYADFAFLSACQTATGDESMPEEAAHLAAGMMIIGYSSVIATMWSIQDDHAPMVADRVYAYMLKDEKPNSRRAAVALYGAVKILRETIGEDEYVSWIPYVHIGV